MDEQDCDQKRIVDNLLASYLEVGGINNIDRHNLPSKRAIAVICHDLLGILFPGFLDDEAPSSEAMRDLTGRRVDDMMERLSREVSRSLQCDAAPPEDLHACAHETICDFLATLPEVRRLLQTDVEAAYEGDPAARSREEIILSYPCLEAIAIQRSAHVLYRQKIPILPRMMTEWAHEQTGIDIHPGARIGTHFFIDHGTGVVIGETCVIGSGVKLYHGVTLGARSLAKDGEGKIVKGTKRHPDVEDDVTIYPNATVLGGETVIGANTTIGGNVFIMESVPANSLVAVGGRAYEISDKASHKGNGKA
jgi:serine O-acetyltransferase